MLEVLISIQKQNKQDLQKPSNNPKAVVDFLQPHNLQQHNSLQQHKTEREGIEPSEILYFTVVMSF